ncbi:MAG: recombinase family protein [Oscillospiraceae bacterium]|jgi:site-specific DNA recombinase|nr:recombinase family protein [Oscillospiraceae bacterium]
METGIYARVSTEEQAKEGYSIRAQEQKLKDYARVKDWQIYDVYIDEGISGKNIVERPEINRLIDDIKSGKVKNVLVFKIDRMTRSTSDLIYLIDLFNENNCAFNSLMESIDTQTASGRMFLKIIGIFAEFERENIAERITLGRERKVNEGYTLCSHTASYGYDRPNGQKIQTIIDSEAQIVREIFDLFVNQGRTFTKIALTLNTRGVPTKLGSKWTTTGVRNILTNNNYAGYVRYNYEDEKRAYKVKGQHKQIIAKELFERAQHRLEKTKRITMRKEPKEENYFANFLVCAKCGWKLKPHNSYKKLKDGTISFTGHYECSNDFVGDCKASSMSANKLEQAFIEYIERIVDFEEDNIVYLNEQEQKKEENQNLILKYQEKLHQFELKEREALDCYVKNIFTIEEYRNAKTLINSDKQLICIELERLRLDSEEIIDNKIQIANNIKENWNKLSYSDKRMFLMQFVEKIVVENEKIGTMSKKGKERTQRKIKIFDIVFKEC